MKTPKFAPSPCDFVTLQVEDRAMAIGNINKEFVKSASVVWEICSRTDRRTHTQTCSLQYFATAAAGEVMNKFDEVTSSFFYSMSTLSLCAV